jgi:uncharacterized damage-inducible protein DinB
MTKIEEFQKEIEKEAITTRKMLAAIPGDRLDWKPHPKSMSIRQLATHIAELPSWPAMALNTDELDFAKADYKPTEIADTASLLTLLEKSLADSRESFRAAEEDDLIKPWTLRKADEIYSTDPKADVIRMSISQTIHHRAQLGVYLRLLDVPIPGSYGPSADDPSF